MIKKLLKKIYYQLPNFITDPLDRMRLVNNQSGRILINDLNKQSLSIPGDDERWPKVSIILLSYNSLPLLQNCLESVLAHTNYPNYELIVVDNCSEVSVQDYLRAMEEKFCYRLILNNKNLGYAGGNNLGLEVARGKYLVLLNNDTVVTEGWLDNLINHFKDKNIGLVGPLTNSSGNNQKISTPDFESISEVNQFARDIYTKNKGRNRLKPDSLSFFAVAISRDLYDRVGGLDENYGIGMFEDDDYCQEVKKAGFSMLVAEDVFVYHAGKASFGKIDNPVYRQLWEQNRNYYQKKWRTKWTPSQ